MRLCMGTHIVESMTPEEERLNRKREQSRVRQQRFKERLIAEGGIGAFRAKMTEYRRRYRAKKKKEEEEIDSDS